jgi:hypothetical protein
VSVSVFVLNTHALIPNGMPPHLGPNILNARTSMIIKKSNGTICSKNTRLKSDVSSCVTIIGITHVSENQRSCIDVCAGRYVVKTGTVTSGGSEKRLDIQRDVSSNSTCSQ